LHGDFQDDSSLVIAEIDCFNRRNFASPMDIKFRADALARTLPFVGNSMSEYPSPAAQAVAELGAIARRRQKAAILRLMPQPDPVQETVLAQWESPYFTGRRPIGAGAVAFLSELKARMGAG
jgi:hypothetical protein